MADNAEPTVIPTGSKYKGKPENFKADFKPKRPPVKAGPKSGTLPPPSNSAGKKNPTPTRDDTIFKDAIFGPEIIVRENNMRTKVQPNCAGLIPIVNDMWSQMRIDENQIDKQITVEALRYYATALLWMRILSLKRSNNLALTDVEQLVWDIVSPTTLQIPEPIYLYLKALGTIQDSATGQTLIPVFPDLPATPVAEFGGYYGAVDADNHNLYEEIPCLGVMAEAIRHTVSNDGAGRYASALDTEHNLVNHNLLGFEDLTIRRNEGKNFYLNIGINENIFPESVEDTALNYDLIFAISTWISTNKTFKIQGVSFDTLGMNGSQTQTIVQRPLPAAGNNALRCIMGETRQTSLSKQSTTMFGLGYYTCFQLHKASADDADNESRASARWCCQTFTGANADHTIPADWIENMNARRNLPVEYNSERFETISMRLGDLRKRTLHNMLIARR